MQYDDEQGQQIIRHLKGWIKRAAEYNGISLAGIRRNDSQGGAA